MNISWIANQVLGVNGKNKNVKIAEQKDYVVAASGNVTVIPDTSLSDYPYHYVVVKADGLHNFMIKEQFKTDGFSVPGSAITIIDRETVAANRGVSEWQKAKGETVHIDIVNLDTENSHTYNLYLLGVR